MGIVIRGRIKMSDAISRQTNYVYCHENDEEYIIRCDDNNAKCLWLLSLILLMKGNNGFCHYAKRRTDE